MMAFGKGKMALLLPIHHDEAHDGSKPRGLFVDLGACDGFACAIPPTRDQHSAI